MLEKCAPAHGLASWKKCLCDTRTSCNSANATAKRLLEETVATARRPKTYLLMMFSSMLVDWQHIINPIFLATCHAITMPYRGPPWKRSLWARHLPLRQLGLLPKWTCRLGAVGGWIPELPCPAFDQKESNQLAEAWPRKKARFISHVARHGLHAELLDCLLKPHAFRRCPALQSLGLGQTPLFVPHLLPVFLVTGEFCLSGVQKTAVVTPSAWPLPKWLVEVVYNGVLRKDGDLGPGIEVEVVHDAHHAQGLPWPCVVVTQQPTNREEGWTREAMTDCCGNSWIFPWVGEAHFIFFSTCRACSLKPGWPCWNCSSHRCLGYPSSGIGSAWRGFFRFLSVSWGSSSSSLSGSSGSSTSSVSQCCAQDATSLDMQPSLS